MGSDQTVPHGRCLLPAARRLLLRPARRPLHAFSRRCPHSGSADVKLAPSQTFFCLYSYCVDRRAQSCREEQTPGAPTSGARRGILDWVGGTVCGRRLGAPRTALISSPSAPAPFSSLLSSVLACCLPPVKHTVLQKDSDPSQRRATPELEPDGQSSIRLLPARSLRFSARALFANHPPKMRATTVLRNAARSPLIKFVGKRSIPRTSSVLQSSL